MTSWNSVEKRSSESGSLRLLLGVGAGIAAYKLAHVVRQLRRNGVDVIVAPTADSQHFVGSTTWSELSENPIADDLFGDGVGHIELARWADLIVIAPATADLLAQLAAGRANTILTATVLASSAPKLVAPAMHTGMWENPATQDNVEVLERRGFAVLQPAAGALSSGDQGVGRLPEPEELTAWIMAHFNEGPLSGRSVVVTTGGTIEEIDPVRYLANHSSGRQGIEIAKAAVRRGASVTLIAGNCTAPLPPAGSRMTIVRTDSAAQMKKAVEEAVVGADALVMAAAVADYRPATWSEGKLKKESWGQAPVINLVANPDILREVCAGPLKPPVVIGFGAETGADYLTRGIAKAKQKGADFLAINRVGEGKGFGDVTNTLTIVTADGDVVEELTGTKTVLAKALIDTVERSLLPLR